LYGNFVSINGRGVRFTSSDFESNSVNQKVEGFHESGVNTIEDAGAGGLEPSIIFERFQNATRQGRVKLFKKLQVDDADAIALGG